MFSTSFSPCGNMIAIASKDTIVICKSKWDENNQAIFKVSSKIELKEKEIEKYRIKFL